jgi:hypothetical protein
VDEYLREYYYADIAILESEVKIKFARVQKSVQYENTPIIVYLTKARALDDIYLFDDKATGNFLQYAKSGKLLYEVQMNKGKIVNTTVR